MTLGIDMLKNIFLSLAYKMYTHDITISILDNIFPMHTETQSNYHLK